VIQRLRKVVIQHSFWSGKGALFKT